LAAAIERMRVKPRNRERDQQIISLRAAGHSPGQIRQRMKGTYPTLTPNAIRQVLKRAKHANGTNL
jgi:hypothetical protein